MIELSGSLKLNEIHVVDSPFNEDPENIIFFPREALISGKRRSVNLGKWAIAGTSIVMHIGVVNFGTKIFVIPQFSYIPNQIVGKKNEKT